MRPQEWPKHRSPNTVDADWDGCMWAVSSAARAQPLASAFAGDRAMQRPATPPSSRGAVSQRPSRIRKPEVEERLDSLSFCDLLGPAFLAGPDCPPRIPAR